MRNHILMILTGASFSWVVFLVFKFGAWMVSERGMTKAVMLAGSIAVFWAIGAVLMAGYRFAKEKHDRKKSIRSRYERR